MINKKIKLNDVSEKFCSQISNIDKLSLLFEVTEDIVVDSQGSIFLSEVLDFSKNISIGGACFELIYREFNENKLKIVVGELKHEKQFIFYIFNEGGVIVSNSDGAGSDYLFMYVYDVLSKKIRAGKIVCNEDYSMAISQIIDIGDELCVNSKVYKLMEDNVYGEFYFAEKWKGACNKEYCVSSDLLEVVDNILAKRNNKVIILKKK